MKSIWKLWCDTRKPEGANKLLQRVEKRFIEDGIVESFFSINIESYHKGGHLASFEVEHTAPNWNTFVAETIELGQRVGYGWALSGDIRADLSGWSNRMSISGIDSMEWTCIKA